MPPPPVAELQQIRDEFVAKHGEYLAIVTGLPLAASDAQDADTASSIVAEGTFIRYFTLWENSVEKAFIYFCCGGTSLAGNVPNCRLVPCSPEEVRKIILSGQRYLDWSDPRLIRDR